jgi:hypothetical protein
MPLAANRRPRRVPAAVAVIVAAVVAATSRPVAAAEGRLIPLERVEAISVLVDDMTPDAEGVALTREIIQTEAESQLLRNGLKVRAQGAMPALYFQISVLCDDRGPCAIDVSSAAIQDVYLDAMGTSTIRAKTWYTGQMILAPRAAVHESVRKAVRGQADEFAADLQAARRRVLGAAPTTAPAVRDDSSPRRGN